LGVRQLRLYRASGRPARNHGTTVSSVNVFDVIPTLSRGLHGWRGWNSIRVIRGIRGVSSHELLRVS